MLLLLLSASCASAPPNLPFIATVAPQAAQLPSPTEPALPSAAVPTTAAASTPTAGEFALDLTPLPTETALPTLALPTESRFAGTFEIWDGLPTYLADFSRVSISEFGTTPERGRGQRMRSAFRPSRTARSRAVSSHPPEDAVFRSMGP